MLATISSAATSTWQDYALTFGQMIAALAIMAVAAWAVTIFGKKRLSRRPKGQIRLMEKMSLENGRGLWLVEVEKRRLLIGSSNGSVHLVCELSGATQGLENTRSTASQPVKVP